MRIAGVIALALWVPALTSAAAARDTEELVVVGERAISPVIGALGSVTSIGADDVALTGAEHVSELLMRVPGVWVTRGSGQEHLTAIRSPVLTGAGACGAFLYMEDGIPIRPPGFCNVNNLFEINTEQAAAVEVARGPASGLFGGNALHGVINVLSPEPQGRGARVLAEGGRFGHYRLGASGNLETRHHALRVDALGVHTNGYRDATGFDEQKLGVTHRTVLGDWRLRTRLAATNLNQETGGFVRGKNAFRNRALRRSNPNPEAYRDAWSARLGVDARRGFDRGELRVAPYVRATRMEFLQHFLPGQPTEKNGHVSAGVLAGWSAGALSTGVQLEYARSYLKEFQPQPLSPTRPQGLHYDYEVDSVLAALHYDHELPLGERVRLIHGVRGEYVLHDYDNRGPDGNGRADGGTCPGGCLFTRPADRDDAFASAGGRLGLAADVAPGAEVYVMGAHGFRAPQITELYRLQNGQQVADLDSERLTSAELGARLARADWRVQVAAFVQRKRNVILRDANGFNVSDGRTRGAGLEFMVAWAPLEWLALDVGGTLSRHRYDFDRSAAAGERIESGNDVDTAPRSLGSAHLRLQPVPALLAELELVRVGRHYLNAANTADYDGHTLANLRASWQATPQVRVFARVMNLLDREYADRADFAFGSFRYFPGEPRRLFAGVEVEF